MIKFFSENSYVFSNKRKASSWIKEAVFIERKKIGEVTIIFCDDLYLLDINKKFLQHDYFTDIITFDYSENDIISGDLYISTETVSQNAKDLSIDFDLELKRVIIHGVLHLLGYNDKTKQESITIRAKEDYYISLYKN